MKVAVVGAGRVGLVSGLVLFELGHELTLVDVDRSRLEQLRAGEMPFFEPGGAELLCAAIGSGRWTVTDAAEAIAACEVVLIAVPTPLGTDGRYDLGPLREAVSTLRRVRAGAAEKLCWRGIFLRSTVLPGTTHRDLGETLVRSSADGSLPCPVGYLPEFLREGTALADARRPDRIVVGADDAALHALARALFDGLHAEFFATGTCTAELIKTANNAMLSVCVSFANEIARLAETIDGVDAVEVFEGMRLDRRFQGTPRAGIVDYLLPGPGFGGSCLGKDLAALVSFAEGQRQEPWLLDAALRINETQPVCFVDRIDAALGGLAGRRVLVLGLAFKPGTDDVRGSVALPIIHALVARGAEVQAHDPQAAQSGYRATLESLGVAVLPDNALRYAGDEACDDAYDDAFDAAEAVVLVTPWPSYVDALAEKLSKRSRPLLLADARGVLRRTERAPCVTYLGIGLGGRVGAT